MSYLTDGFVEEWFVQSWGPNAEACAQRLVDQGLWLEVAGGWQFHDWDEFQPTREKVEAEREAAAERMRRVRANRTANVRPNERGTNGVGSATPSPSPSPDLLLTDLVGLGSNARENSTDKETVEQIEASKRTAKTQRLDLDRIKSLASERCGRDLGFGEALRLGVLIVSKSKTVVRSPSAYVATAFDEWQEVQRLIDTEVRL
jgi:hypothetical protein